MFQFTCVGTVMAYHHTEIYILSSSGSLVTAIKLQAKTVYVHSLHLVILPSTEVLCLWQLGICPWSNMKTDWKVGMSVMLLLVMVRKYILWLRCVLAWHNFRVSVGLQDLWTSSLLLYSQKLRDRMKSRSPIINSKGHIPLSVHIRSDCNMKLHENWSSG
jgi:hypothetical protein